MRILKNKRGLELAIGTVAVIAMGLLVIIVVIGFFLGGFGRAGGGIAQISEQGESGASNLTLKFMCLATSSGDADECGLLRNATECDAKTGCYWGFGQTWG